MYEIDLSTLILIGLDEVTTRVITTDRDFIVNESSKKIIDNSCRFFGSSLKDRLNTTKRLLNIASKSPIVVEDTRNLIFFPLKSTREKNNIWISFNNVQTYTKDEKSTIIIFKNGKRISLNFSYYVIDNQITRSLMLDYELNVRRKSLEK